MSFVCGQGVRVVKKRSDEDVVGMCLAMLSRLFPEQVMIQVNRIRKLCNAEGGGGAGQALRLDFSLI